MKRRFRSGLRAGAAMVLVAAALAGTTSALGHGSGARPIPGEFKGRFAGSRLGDIQFHVLPISPTSPRVAAGWFGGFVPGVCVKNGKTQAFGIGFNLDHGGLRVRPRTREIPANGAFAFRLEHQANVFNGESYSLSIRGTFGRKTVSGRVQGTGTNLLAGKCRANRTFTARLSTR